jgi:Fur family ferric uptake transcriptional regulator
VETSSELNFFKDFLRENNYPLTQPRETILRAFLESNGYVGARELHREAKKWDKQISLSTVYRTMHLIVECGLANQNTFGIGAKYFQKVSGKKNHDQLVCTLCGKVVMFQHPLIEASNVFWQEEVAKKHQFFITSHGMTLFGICGDCG